jgi:hypothetical protein
MTRAFLLTNLDATVQPYKFQVPLDIIGSSIPDLGGFPYRPGERSWHGNTLFVKGAKSKYINKNNIPTAKEFFPRMSLETLDAGHWGTCRQSFLRGNILKLFGRISSRGKVRFQSTPSVPCVLC